MNRPQPVYSLEEQKLRTLGFKLSRLINEVEILERTTLNLKERVILSQLP